MPTYEYACRACGEHLEVVQSFKDYPLTDCPACGGDLRKVFSAAGLIFKGSGWHIKDYAPSTQPVAASSTSSSDGKGSSSEGASSASTSKSSGASSESAASAAKSA